MFCTFSMAKKCDVVKIIIQHNEDMPILKINLVLRYSFSKAAETLFISSTPQNPHFGH